LYRRTFVLSTASKQHLIMSKLPQVLLFLLFFCQLHAQIRLQTPGTESILYLGAGKKQALVVGLGGSEGGNAWTSKRWKPVRDRFLSEGYAFLAIGYFGAPGTPDTLNRIDLEVVHNAIRTAARHKKVDGRRIALIGGSRGGDLALLLASYYKDIDAVVGLMASNATFPGHTSHFSTPCWSYRQRDLPFVPLSEAAIAYLEKGQLRATFEVMLHDSAAVEQAAIRVENIRGPILLLSAVDDEVCPSTPMAQALVARLEKNGFPYPVEHHAIPGGHIAPLQHFDLVFDFLNARFRKKRG
jgi:uncharacterized protein